MSAYTPQEMIKQLRLDVGPLGNEVAIYIEQIQAELKMVEADRDYLEARLAKIPTP